MVYDDAYNSEVVWDKKEIHLVSDLVQPKAIIPFGLHNQKIILRVYKKIKNYVQKNMKISSGAEGIARIEIQKRIDLIQVIIFMGFPKLLIESRPRGIEELQMNLQKEFHYVNRKLNIAITRIAKPYGNPNILKESKSVKSWIIKIKINLEFS